MHIGIEYRTPWTVLRLTGNLDADAGPNVYQQFQSELLRGGTRFLFALDGVETVDSTGLGVLVRCYRDAKGRGGELRLSNVPPSIGRILEFTRLDSILRPEPRTDDALAGSLPVTPALDDPLDESRVA